MDWIISMIHSLSCSNADAASRKASTLSDTSTSFHRLVAQECVFIIKTKDVSGRAATACGLFLNCTLFPADPNFPKVARNDLPWKESCWTFPGMPRSFSPVFSPEPLRWMMIMIKEEKSFPCGVQLTVPLLRRPRGTFPKMGCDFLRSLHRRFPRRPEQWFPICGPRTLKAQNDELQLFSVNSLNNLFGLDVTPPSNCVTQGNSHLVS